MTENKKGFAGHDHWYKGNLHSHTTNSDGKLNPSEAVRLYTENGYHFLCFSEHDLYTDYSETFTQEGFLILPGLEASVALQNPTGKRPLTVHHLHGILGTAAQQAQAKDSLLTHMDHLEGERHMADWDGYHEAQSLNDRLRAHGLFTTYNHPIWSKSSEEEVCRLENLWAVEIYNYNTVNESGTGYNTTFWDRMLRMGKRIHGFASDDNHNEGLFPDSCAGYVVVNAEALTHESIVSNLQSGNFYSSCGPEIYDWGITNGKVYVDCSPVNRVNFICGNYVNHGQTVMEHSLTDHILHAEYDLSQDEKYVRIECVDKYGRTAWTNALFLTS